MRILFDNGTPRQLRLRLFGHVVEEARERGWDGLSNGDLLDRAEEVGFDVLITTDQGIQHQQNMSNRQVAVVVLMKTAWPRISQRTEAIRIALDEIHPGEVREVPIPMRDEAYSADHRHQRERAGASIHGSIRPSVQPPPGSDRRDRFETCPCQIRMAAPRPQALPIGHATSMPNQAMRILSDHGNPWRLEEPPATQKELW